MDGLTSIMKFQIDRGLDKQQYSGANEQTNILEEILEARGLKISKENRGDLMDEFDEFAEMLEERQIASRMPNLMEHEMVDAYNDVIVFAVGSIMKLGHNPKLTLKEVAKEINSRKGSMVNGKFEKDLNQDPATLYLADYTTCRVHQD